MLRSLVIGTLLLFATSSAWAQSLTTGITDTACRNMGGQILTYTGTPGTSVANIVECYRPPTAALRAGAVQQLPASPASRSLGMAAGMLGAAGGMIQMMDALDRSQTNAAGGPAPAPRGPDNGPALATVAMPGTAPLGPLPAAGSQPELFAANPAARRYAAQGVLNDPALIASIEGACAGTTALLEMVCVTDRITAALIERLPAAREECGNKSEPYRGICAARVQMEAVGLRPGECVGDCNGMGESTVALTRRYRALLHRSPQGS